MAGIPKSPNFIQRVADLEFPGGPIPLDSRFYIDRTPAEARACAEIGKPGSLIRIKAPRKMGKSSLMLRIIQAALARGYRTVTVDFQQADEAAFASLDKFLRWLCVNAARQLKLPPNLDDFWDEDMGSKVSCTMYFENYLLEEIETPIVLVLNEVNRVFERTNIAQEFLPLSQSGIYSEHIQSQSIILQKNPALSEAFQQVISSQNSIYIEPLIAYQLDSMGLVKLEGNNCQVSCELYRLYFQEEKLSEPRPRVCLEDLQQENERLQALVNVDELTQIGNRRHFDSCLRAEWKHMSRDGSPISLILCDIDYFKVYNDTYGHQAGDSCLRSVAQAIARSLKHPADVAARYGGEEFAVILPSTDASAAMIVAETIRANIKSLNLVFKHSKVANLPNPVVTISLGIASVVPGPENDISTLVLAADEALYDSKRQGRDRATLSTLLNFRFAS